MEIATLIHKWLTTRLEPPAMEWLQDRLTAVRAGERHRFQLAFGMAPRKTGKGDLALSKAELLQAEDARPGWDPSEWSLDHAARTLIVLSFPSDSREEFLATLDQLFAAGEVSELVALYQMLPLLPDPESHVSRAVDGLRTNIRPVFAAIAHRNPYPAERFSDAQWNQMVLKTLFVDLPLAPIVGLDERINESLMRNLCDLAHERWAAGRTVSPELWRCVGPIADEAALADLRRVLRDGTPSERQAAALSLSTNEKPAAKELLTEFDDLASDIRTGQITWDKIALAETSAGTSVGGSETQ